MVFEEFIGQTAEVLFETGFHFKLEYLDKDTLRWTSLKEEDNGKTETEPIYTYNITENHISVNWIESTGVSVSHIINPIEGTIWAYMSWNDENQYGGRAVLTHKGTFTFLS